MTSSTLKQWFPHTQSPLIISAPMLGVSNGKLSSAVSQAGGLGFMPGGYFFDKDSANYKALTNYLQDARKLLTPGDGDLLNVGVGIITCNQPSFQYFATTTLPLLEEYKVCSLWMFAPDSRDLQGPSVHKEFVKLVRERGDWGERVKVWIQVGTVAAARQAVGDGADLVVAQGVDAGGHQFATGAGTIGLVPEVVDAVEEESGKVGRVVVVVAAGGISDGRGVVAALGLGAQAAVMGTRFVVANESDAQDFKKQNLVAATDGGLSTVKSKFHDDIQSATVFPAFYDGRALLNASCSDMQRGLSMEENLKRFKEAKEAGDMTRMVTWSGTGVGLVKQTQPAGDIVKEVRTQAKDMIAHLSHMLE